MLETICESHLARKAGRQAVAQDVLSQLFELDALQIEGVGRQVGGVHVRLAPPHAHPGKSLRLCREENCLLLLLVVFVVVLGCVLVGKAKQRQHTRPLERFSDRRPHSGCNTTTALWFVVSCVVPVPAVALAAD